jgi:hypothetical protein
MPHHNGSQIAKFDASMRPCSVVGAVTLNCVSKGELVFGVGIDLKLT